MNLLASIGIVVITSFVSIFGLYNWLPLHFLQPEQPVRFGSTITTIAGTDTLSSSRTTINNNFANLNAGKEEISDLVSTTTLSSLANVGTLITGTWNATAIGVGYGGTGTTSPTTNQVMLGNGASGFKAVSGFGASGQFLTSGGAAAPPTWTTGALDYTANYSWTGNSLFKNFSASSTVANPITLNGLTFSTNGTRQASSTILAEDGNGKLSFVNTYAQKFYLNTSTTGISASQASTTIFSVSVPANTLGTSNAILCRFSAPIGSTVSTAKLKIDVSYGGTASSSIITNAMGAGSGNLYVSDVSFLLSATGATNTQKLSLYDPDIYDDATRQSQLGQKDSTPNVDSTVAQPLLVVMAFATANGTIPAGQAICTLIR